MPGANGLLPLAQDSIAASPDVASPPESPFPLQLSFLQRRLPSDSDPGTSRVLLVISFLFLGRALNCSVLPLPGLASGTPLGHVTAFPSSPLTIAPWMCEVDPLPAAPSAPDLASFAARRFHFPTD